jgi:hypothetical protein
MNGFDRLYRTDTQANTIGHVDTVGYVPDSYAGLCRKMGKESAWDTSRDSIGCINVTGTKLAELIRALPDYPTDEEVT